MKLPWPLILASTSKYRGMLFSQLGWPFEAMNPGVDESSIKDSGYSPEALASKLSYMKAHAIYAKNQQSCVIGSDQVCRHGKDILSKPGSREKAIEQLTKLQGTSHELLTAVTILSPGINKTFVNKTTLKMRKLTLSEIESYLDFDRPFDCAGSYKLESRGIKLFEKIEMDDHTAIIGLPLIELTNVLVAAGYPV